MSEFTFDSDKNAENLRKHGVSLALAEQVLADPYFVEEEDRTVDYGEIRFRAFGLVDGLVYGVIYADRVDHVRIISVRPATRRETARYFQSRR